MTDYEQKLREHYFKNKHLMTDLEIHNTEVRINRAVFLHEQGLTSESIKEVMRRDKEDVNLNVKKQRFEQAKEDIQRVLLRNNYDRTSKAYKKKEMKLLLKWAKLHK